MFLEHVYEILRAKHDRWFQGYWTKNIEEPALEDPRHASARIAWLRQCLEQSFRDGESDRASCDLPQNATHLSHWIQWSPYLTICHHAWGSFKRCQEQRVFKSCIAFGYLCHLLPNLTSVFHEKSEVYISFQHSPAGCIKIWIKAIRRYMCVQWCEAWTPGRKQWKSMKKWFWLI